MRGGAKALLVSASLAVTGCTAAQSDFKIRPIADPATKKLRPGSDLLADARGQLALGDVGLAIEGYRKALRQQPTSIEAYAGLAACYEAMGRYDVARSNYERALAIAPKDPTLLNTFALALERWGNRAQAAEVRSEIADLAAASAVLDQAAPDSVAEVSQPVSIAMAQSKAIPAPTSKAVVAPVQSVAAMPKPNLVGAPVAFDRGAPIAMSRPRLVSEPVRIEEEAAVAMPKPVATTAPVTVERQSPVAVMAGAPATASSITVKLPPEPSAPVGVAVAHVPVQAPAVPDVPMPKPGPTTASVTVERQAPVDSLDHAPAMASSITVKLPPARPVVEKPAEQPRPQLPIIPPTALVDVSSGPRLERLSLGEVALITMVQPARNAQYVKRMPQMATVKWVPLKTGPSAPNVVLLNAARHQNLAANNRKYLYALGWRKIEIGDAPQTRERTIVLYPAGRERTARSLAAQFGCGMMKSEGQSMVVLLGRDATAARG